MFASLGPKGLTKILNYVSTNGLMPDGTKTFPGLSGLMLTCQHYVITRSYCYQNLWWLERVTFEFG